MIVSELFSHINAAYRGTDDDQPVLGTTDGDEWLLTANRKISEWAKDGKNTWMSLFDIRTVGTFASGTQSYDLDDEIILPADEVTITSTAGNDSYFKIAKPQERRRFLNSVYISGRDPQVLTFYDTIPSTSLLIGGSIKIAGYYVPDDLVAAGDTIPVDDPYWLVMAVASELAFNDITYSDKAPDLNAKANNLYSIMVSNNRRGTNDNPRIARTNVDRILGTTDERRGW